MKYIPISLVEKAARIAARAHAGVERKDDSLYIVHPFMVALKLAKHNFPEPVIAAALTHDVLEDTDYPEEKLRKELGDETVNIVKAVTNSSDKSISWREKKNRYVETTRKGPAGAKAVSVADKIHNLECLLIAHAEQGPAIWGEFHSSREDKRWYEEAVLKMLKETWDHTLIAEYERLLKKEKDLK